MNVNLIRELNADHAALKAKLDSIKERGVLDAEARRLLIEIRSDLIAHLGKEERDFYPVMRNAALTNEGLRSTLKKMGDEMDAVSVKALRLIDDWVSGKGSTDFAASFESFCAILCDRITREEHSLYSKYLKLVRA